MQARFFFRSHCANKKKAAKMLPQGIQSPRR